MAAKLAPHNLLVAVQVVGAVAFSNQGTVEFPAVQQNQRNKGIGRLLDAQSVDAAAAMGCQQMTLAPRLLNLVFVSVSSFSLNFPPLICTCHGLRASPRMANDGPRLSGRGPCACDPAGAPQTVAPSQLVGAASKARVHSGRFFEAKTWSLCCSSFRRSTGASAVGVKK